MAARALTASLIVLIIGASAAGWFRFAVAAGGAGVADSPAVSALTQAAIARATGDPVTAEEAAWIRLAPAEVAWLAALQAVSLRARKIDTASASDQVSSRTDGRAGESPVLAEQTSPSVSAGDIPFLLAALVAASFDRQGDGAALAESPSTQSAIRSRDATGLSGKAGQSHETATAPGLLDAAMAAIGLQRADAASVGDASLARLGSSIVGGTVLADSQATAFTSADIDALRDLAAATLAAAYIDASYLDSTFESDLRAIVGEGLPLAEGIATHQAASAGATVGDATGGRIGGSHGDLQRLVEMAAAMLGNESAKDRAALAALVVGALRVTEAASLDDHAGPLTGIRTGSRFTMRAAAGAAARRENAAALGLADHWAASLTSAGSSFLSPGSREPAFARRDASAIAASLSARIRQRRVDTTQVAATLELRTTRGPSAVPQIRDIVNLRFVHRGVEPLAILAVAGFAAGSTHIDRPRMAEAVSFTVAASPVAGASGGAVAADRTRSPTIAGAQAGPIPQPEDPESVVIVPPRTAGSPATKSEVVSIVWPTRAAILHVPGQGVTLNVPAGARSAVFQTRVAVESPQVLEVPPEGDVLRVVRIEIFDALGRPVADPAPRKPLDLIIHLAAEDLERLSGGKPGREPRSELMKLQRFDPESPEPGWRDIPIREVDDDAVAATLEHLSLFALVAKRAVADVPVIEQPPQRIGRRAPHAILVAAVAVGFGVLIALYAVATAIQPRRDPRA